MVVHTQSAMTELVSRLLMVVPTLEYTVVAAGPL